MLPLHVFDSLAYRFLKPGPRSMLWELIRRYNGLNNGEIVMSARQACEALNIFDKDTALRYLAALQDCGLIKPTKLGGFNIKDPANSRATEWALTWHRLHDQPPTKEFMKWKPAKKCGPENAEITSG